ncbi:MAG: two-component sensor histidine kinase [Zetaproteobacteria bacterium]|nr:MAG: two-component sensor histidine kinase [Zetaproteobacteria bacterium]
MVPEARRSEAQLLQRRYATAEAVARIALELAHEVKNPLAALRGTAQWMAERQTHAAIEEGCARLLAEFDRIRERIDAFLQLAPRAALSMESVNIHALIHDVCRPVPEGVELRLVLDPSLPELSAHGARLRQALENLWRNALEAHARTIEIETRVAQGGTLPGHKGPVLQICFRSDGDPIPEAIRPQLFDPFVTGKDGGSGLGLAIVQRVLQEHGGHIRLADDRHHTRFILHLPIRRTHNPERCA